MRNLFLLSLIFLSLPLQAWAAPELLLANTGLVPSNIWYSKDPFYAGDKIRIYSVIFTGSTKDLRGRVNFYDNGSLLCTSEFSSLAGRVSDVWCDWSVVAGKHSISIQIVNPRASIPGEPEQDVLLSNSELKVPERIVTAAPKAGNSADAVGINNESKPDAGIIQDITNVFSGAATTVPAGYVAKVSPALNSVKTGFSAFSDKIASQVLPELKALSESPNKPMAYVMSFIYAVVKFILETPIVLALIILLVVWKSARIILKKFRG